MPDLGQPNYSCLRPECICTPLPGLRIVKRDTIPKKSNDISMVSIVKIQPPPRTCNTLILHDKPIQYSPPETPKLPLKHPGKYHYRYRARDRKITSETLAPRTLLTAPDST